MSNETKEKIAIVRECLCQIQLEVAKVRKVLRGEPNAA